MLISCVAATQVKVLDYDEPKYVNFEAEVHFPEEEGIVQIENFGVHINEEGFLAFGMTVDGIMDRYARPVFLLVRTISHRASLLACQVVSSFC